jgi:hypothetical protein
MPVNRHGVEETRTGFRPTDRVDYPVTPPKKPDDSERSARPPAFWKDRGKKRD